MYRSASTFMLSLVAFMSQATELPVAPTSVAVTNLSGSAVQVWISGSEYLLKEGLGVLIPCFSGESVEVQLNGSIEFLECGERRELK